LKPQEAAGAAAVIVQEFVPLVRVIVDPPASGMASVALNTISWAAVVVERFEMVKTMFRLAGTCTWDWLKVLV
jgi:hypothetical protein